MAGDGEVTFSPLFVEERDTMLLAAVAQQKVDVMLRLLWWEKEMFGEAKESMRKLRSE